MDWVRSLYGFAIVPDIVFYLKVNVKTLLYRVLMSGKLDYWEAGMDQYPGNDPYDSFRRYQAKLIKEYNRLAEEFGFVHLNARRSVGAIQKDLRTHVAELLSIELSSGDLKISPSEYLMQASHQQDV